jgi:DNA polymerase-3 subunit alpha
MEAEFIHLNCHTEFSLIDSTIRIKPLLAACKEADMPAIAMNDHMNLFAVVKLYKAANGQGIKPIIGSEVILQNPDDEKYPFKATLLCKNNDGYQSLIKLVSRAYLEGQTHGSPIIERKWLAESCNGLLMLSGAQFGDVGQLLCAGKPAKAEKLAARWMDLFPDSFYLELQRVGRPNEEFYIKQAIELAEKLSIPVVATNAVRFLLAEDFNAHETRVAIHDGYTLADPKRPQHYTAQQYLRSAQEMKHLFADIPSAIENTVQIAKRCNLTVSLNETFLPNYPIPAGMTTDQYFHQVSEQGLEERLTVLLDSTADDYQEKLKAYRERLQIELDVIIQMGFPGYFLIVADFIQWAKDNDVPVGPGRGSGAGSLVAYALKITDLDPLEYGLLFERFLNPERVSMPDFDIDFCMEGRDSVIEYVAKTYGKDAVSQIITYGTMAAKAVIRDVGRVLGHPYGFIDKLAKLIPFEIGMTLTKALQQEPQLADRYQREDEVKQLFDLALKLEGLTRNVGKHAGGVVIAPSTLSDFTPVYTEGEGGSLVSQYDKDDVEAVGLVKFDFLGLRTLTIIDWAVKAVNKRLVAKNEPVLDIARIDIKDTATFDLLKACNTTAVFQLESRGMKDLIKRLQPDCFEDIIALVALFRPGPLQSGMVDDFIDRKHGRAKVEFPHPALEEILTETYGTILYQEQVMQIAQILSGYSLGSADILRRAMGKKKPEEMAKQRVIFMEGAVKNNVEAQTATHIFDMMEKFAAYGFNKSHSAAYALLSYQTAWLKVHYPAEFMAAVLSSDMDNTDKVVIFFEDAKDNGITILPPNINESEYKFTANDAGQILYGLGAVKGAGEAAIEILVQERKDNGPFTDLFELCQRIDLRKANRRVLEALIKSGAFDVLGQDRAILQASLEKALKSAEQASRNKNIGQTDLFGGVTSASMPADYVQVPAWTEKQRLDAEKESLGLYLSGHPLDRYQTELKHISTCKIKDFEKKRFGTLRLAGMIIGLRTVNTRKGDRMAIITLDDKSGRTDIAIFPKMYQEIRDMLHKDNIIVVEGDMAQDRFTGGVKFNPRTVLSFSEARNAYSQGILLSLEKTPNAKQVLAELKNILQPHTGGGCRILVDYQRDDATARLNLSQEWSVRPTDELLDNLRQVIGEEKVHVIYK